MGRAERWVAGPIALGLAALVSACAGVPRDPSLPIDDPWEQTNRGVLRANQVVLDPVANVVKTLPGPVLNRVQDLDSNLKEPRIFGNDILQGRFGAAAVTLQRFVFNSIFGLGGLVDVATPGGLPKQTGDFGQTLFVWGVPRSLCRATLLRSLDAARFVRRSSGYGRRPARLGGRLLVIGWPWSVGTASVSATAHLGQWKEAENASIDFYSFLRSDYYQTRRAQLREALGLPAVVESPATAPSR